MSAICDAAQVTQSRSFSVTNTGSGTGSLEVVGVEGLVGESFKPFDSEIGTLTGFTISWNTSLATTATVSASSANGGIYSSIGGNMYLNAIQYTGNGGGGGNGAGAGQEIISSPVIVNQSNTFNVSQAGTEYNPAILNAVTGNADFTLSYLGGSPGSIATLAKVDHTNLSSISSTLTGSVTLTYTYTPVPSVSFNGAGSESFSTPLSTDGGLAVNVGFEIDYLLVGGGGGGGGADASLRGAGGGGGGAVVGGQTFVTAESMSVTVGSGGLGGEISSTLSNRTGKNGSPTSLQSIQAIGGGGGGAGANDASNAGSTGASGGGGGGGGNSSQAGSAGGLGTNGFKGGASVNNTSSAPGGSNNNRWAGGGGGGASALGTAGTQDGSSAKGGDGGAPATSQITGTTTSYGGGGGGGAVATATFSSPISTAGSGGGAGAGSGGAGNSGTKPGANASANTGSGGGGAAISGSGGNGGSGIAIVRYKGAAVATGGTISEGNPYGYTMHTFNTPGNASIDFSSLNFATRAKAYQTGDITGSGNLIINGPGTLGLSRDGIFTGKTRVVGGNLLIYGPRPLQYSTLDMNAADSGTVTFQHNSYFSVLGGLQGSRDLSIGNNSLWVGANHADTTYTGTLSGSGGLVKQGNGKLTLNATQSYTGSTLVQSGTLELSGDASISPSTYIIVKPDATLDLLNLNTSFTLGANRLIDISGTIKGDVTIAGRHIPTSPVTTQSIEGNLTYANGSIVEWGLYNSSADSADRGVKFSGIDASGNLAITGSTSLYLVFSDTRPSVSNPVRWTDAMWDSPHVGTNGWKIMGTNGTISGLQNITIVPAQSTMMGRPEPTSDHVDYGGTSLSTARPGAHFKLFQAADGIYLNYLPTEEQSLSHLEQWRLTNFGSDLSEGPGEDLADPDGDGLSNLLEYSLGLDPNVSGQRSASVEMTGGNLEYLYQRSTAARENGMLYQVEWSDTMETGTWSVENVVEETLGTEGALENIKATIPAGSSDRRFLRLRVSGGTN